MKRMRIMGLCLVAVFAFTAFAASSAFALPEFARCQANLNGKYKDSNCNEKAKTIESEEQFELVKTYEKVGFTSAGGAGVLETEAGTRIECTAQSASGKIDVDLGSTGKQLPSKQVESVVAKFNGCALPLIGAKCNSAGSAEGEIITKELEGELGYIKKATKEVGQRLTPTIKKGKFAEFECSSAAKVTVGEGGGKGGNCIIAPVKPVNTSSTGGEEVYSGAAGKQSPQSFETPIKTCNLESNLNGGAFERATQALTTVLLFEEAYEVRA